MVEVVNQTGKDTSKLRQRIRGYTKCVVVQVRSQLVIGGILVRNLIGIDNAAILYDRSKCRERYGGGYKHNNANWGFDMQPALPK